ncbi:chaoptin-like isoform X2 [Artemia franciscana]
MEEPSSLHYSQDIIRDISCVGVPFGQIPALPEGRIAHVDIVNSGLEVMDNFKLILSNSTVTPSKIQIDSLRCMSNKIKVINDDVFEPLADDLATLDLSYNEIDELPIKALKSLSSLSWVNFHNNKIATLDGTGPLWTHLSRTLSALFIGNNKLSELPKGTDERGNHDSLSRLRHLDWLNLDGNNLEELHPESLPPRIHTLSVAQNRLSIFPTAVVEYLKELRWLDLRGNLITELPSTFHRSWRIRLDKLDLGENLLTKLSPESFNRSITVRDLHLDHNRLNYIPSNAFRGMNVARLYLSSNSIREIDDKAFHGVGGNIILLDLERNNFNETPKALKHLKRLRFLYLGNNEISKVDTETFSSLSGSLEALSLSNNHLESIPSAALHQCKKLLHLNLDYNHISMIDRRDFKEWANNLDTLILRGNRISKLQSNLFMYARGLRELIIAFNKISDIHEEAFVDISDSLETLDASFAFQKPIFPDKAIRYLTSLQWLSLDNNEFRHIHAQALVNLTALRYIGLEWNRFESLPKGLFSSAAHRFLRDIRLNDNHLEHISTNTFSNLRELENLILSNNRLHTIYIQAFNALPRLTTLSLTSNKIQKIDIGAFYNLQSLTRLDLQFNKLTTVHLDMFHNVSHAYIPLAINISQNSVGALIPSTKYEIFHIRSIDLSYNRIAELNTIFLSQTTESLRKLFLGHNRIRRLEENHFQTLRDIQLIHIQHNMLEFIGKTAFSGALNVQSIDLSWNRIDNLPYGAFRGLKYLRVLDLSNNNLKSLPRDIVEGTSIETLNLAANALTVLPVSVLSSVGTTLVNLNLNSNDLDHLDAMSFSDFRNIISMDFSKNKFSLLPDNVFVQLGSLISLDLSFNILKANFKELFHYLVKLKELNMASTELTAWPALPLPNLVALNLSRNLLGHDRPTVMTLDKLRSIDLSYNRFTSVPNFLWNRIPLLGELDLSNNPIKTVNRESFTGLWRLESLDLLNRKLLNEIEEESFRSLPLLSNIRMPLLKEPPLSVLFHRLKSLRKVYLEAFIPSISSQLVNIASLSSAVRLRELEIEGESLKFIASDTVARMGIQSSPEFLLSIHDTGVKYIPEFFLRGLEKVTVVALDLRNNQISSLSSSGIQMNNTMDLEGARQLFGGLVISGNPLICGCDIAWLGPWLRRWQRELLTHNPALVDTYYLTKSVRKPTCIEKKSKKRRYLIDSIAAEVSCSILAYSRGNSEQWLASKGVIAAGILLSLYTVL